jgi:glyoxylase-like metal-dependent hydrolase (beta-lactamase superfamily II)
MLHAAVAEGVHRVEDAYTNFYVVEDGGRLTVVDACVPRAWSALHDALGALGRAPGDIEALVLTHAHFDHLGFAERARAELGVPVHVHVNDAPLTRHPLQYGHEANRLRYLGYRAALPILGELLRARALWPPPVAEVQRFGDGGELDVPGRPRVVFCPGHTLGHCALHLPDRDVLIAGDAVVMLDPYTGARGPRIVSRAATADSARALATLDAVAATGAGTVLTGHGEPWTGGAAAAVERARAAGVS